MLIPVRCFSCSKVIGQKWNLYQEKVSEYLESGNTEMEANGHALDDVELTRYCCRRMLLSHVNLIDQLLQYSNNPGEKSCLKHTEALPEDYQEPEPEPEPVPESEEEVPGDLEEEYNLFCAAVLLLS